MRGHAKEEYSSNPSQLNQISYTHYWEGELDLLHILWRCGNYTDLTNVLA